LYDDLASEGPKKTAKDFPYLGQTGGAKDAKRPERPLGSVSVAKRIAANQAKKKRKGSNEGRFRTVQSGVRKIQG